MTSVAKKEKVWRNVSNLRRPIHKEPIPRKQDQQNEDIMNEVCFVQQVQEKLSNLLSRSANVSSSDDLNNLKSYLDLLRSRSEEMIAFIQVMLKLKKQLATARLDLTRTQKLGFEAHKYEGRVIWLEERLKKLSKSCDHFFKNTENELRTEGIRLSESMFSLELKEALRPTTRAAMFNKDNTYKGMEETTEGRSLKGVQKDVRKAVHGRGVNKESAGVFITQDDELEDSEETPKVREKPVQELPNSVHRLKTADASKEQPLNDSIENDLEQAKMTVSSLIGRNKSPSKKSETTLDDTNEVDSYWNSEHHRHEWSNFYMQKIAGNSWHRLGISHPDSFLKKQTYPSAELPWQQEAGNDLIGYHKLALNRLIVRLHKMYEAVEQATLSSVEDKSAKPDIRSLKRVTYALQAKQSLLTNKSTISNQRSDSTVVLPAISPSPTSASKTAVVADNTPSYTELEKIERTVEQPPKQDNVYPRTPTLWCREEDYKHVASIVDTKRDTSTSSSLSRITFDKRQSIKTPKVADIFKPDKKMIMKRAAARVKAVAKIKLGLHHDDENHEAKMRRIDDFLSVSGIESENELIAIDAAKGLGQLKCSDEKVISGLKKKIADNKKSLLAYECSKSMILLGKWHPAAVQLLNTYLQRGNKNIQQDVLAAVKKSQNSQFVNKSSPEISTLGATLIQLIRSSEHADLRFDAAVALGHMCINDSDARSILIEKLNDPSYTVKASALFVLVKQMNYKEPDVIEAILQQASSANSWKHRMQALDLLSFVGVRGLKRFGMDAVFDILESLLWNHPSKEFRCRVAKVLSDFGLRNEACYVTFKRLDDKDEIVRAGAIIALATLEMKGEKVLKALIDILELDVSLYVRTQVIKSFHAMKWNDPRIIRALQERERGEGVLAEEARKALKELEYL